MLDMLNVIKKTIKQVNHVNKTKCIFIFSSRSRPRDPVTFTWSMIIMITNTCEGHVSNRSHKKPIAQIELYFVEIDLSLSRAGNSYYDCLKPYFANIKHNLQKS